MSIHDIHQLLIDWSEATAAFKGGDITARNRKYGLEDELEPLLKQLSAADAASLQADPEAGVILKRICEALDIKLEAAAEATSSIAACPAALLAQWRELDCEIRRLRYEQLDAAQIAELRTLQERRSALGDALAFKLREMHDDGVLSAFERSLPERGVLYQVADEFGCHDLFSLDGMGIEPAYDLLVRMQQRNKAALSFADLDGADWQDDELRNKDLERFAAEYGDAGAWVVRAYNTHLSLCEADDDRYMRAQRAVQSVARENLSKAIDRLRSAILFDRAAYKEIIDNLSQELDDLKAADEDCTLHYEEVRDRRDGYRAFVRTHVRELDVALEPQPRLAPVMVETATETATELERALADQMDELFRKLGF